MSESPHIRDERGFTFLEILVVLVIIGTLAAIAVPVFLGQANRAHDADAKSEVGALATFMEICFVDHESYAPCSPPGTTGNKGKGKGQGQRRGVVKDRSKEGYEVLATSHSGSTFTLRRTTAGMQRACSPAGKGGCPAGGSW